MKKTFKFDFGDQVVEFDVLRLGELRALDGVVASIKDATEGTNNRAIAQISSLIPYLAKAAQRVNKDVTQERLEELLDMYNFTEVFHGVLMNSYGGGAKEGEALPVQ